MPPRSTLLVGALAHLGLARANVLQGNATNARSAYQGDRSSKQEAVKQRVFRQLIDFSRLSGAPGGIRTPDPLLRRNLRAICTGRQAIGSDGK